MEKLNEELTRTTHNYRNKLDEEFAKKEMALNAQIEESKNILNQDIANKEQILKAEKEALEKQRKELDDKSNTHARRQIRKDILEEIKRRQQQFALTAGTNALRKPVAYAMYALIVLFLPLTIFSVLEFARVLEGTDFNKIVLAAVK